MKRVFKIPTNQPARSSTARQCHVGSLEFVERLSQSEHNPFSDQTLRLRDDMAEVRRGVVPGAHALSVASICLDSFCMIPLPKPFHELLCSHCSRM